MDKDTKIELLKIIGMIIILVLLIWGIVWMNSDHTSKEENTINTEESQSVEDGNVNEEVVIESDYNENDESEQNNEENKSEEENDKSE